MAGQLQLPRRDGSVAHGAPRRPRRHRAQLPWLAALALGVALASCGGGSSDPGKPQAASLLATEAACSYSHVYLTVKRLRVRLLGDAVETWHDISLPQPRRFDLRGADVGILEALRTAPLPAGRYAEIRLLLASDPMANTVQPTGGTEMPLSVPGGAVGGLRLRGTFEVPARRFADIVPVGLGSCAGVVRAGVSGQYQLQPGIDVRADLLAAGQEHRLDGEQVLALPAGGFGIGRRDSATGVLKRHAADGSFAGAEVPLDPYGDLTPLRGGHHVLTWLLPPTEGPGAPTQPERLMMHVVDAAGAPVGDTRQVGNAITWAVNHVYPPTLPQAGDLGSGSFALLWSDGSHHLGHYAADGNALSPPGTLQLTSPARMLVLASGRMLIVSGLTTIMAGTYGADGSSIAPAHVVADTGWNPPMSLGGSFDASALVGGGAVVAWSTAVRVDTGEFPDLHVRLLDADGTPAGADTVLGPIEGGPSVTGLPDGGFVVAWVVQGHVRAARFGADGSAAATASRLDAITTRAAEPTVIVAGDGGLLVSWNDVDLYGQRVRYGRLLDAQALLP